LGLAALFQLELTGPQDSLCGINQQNNLQNQTMPLICHFVAKIFRFVA